MENNDFLLIGERVRQLRQKKLLTLQQVANKAKISKGLLSKIENGRSIPSLHVLFAIIRALDVVASDFFDTISSKKEVPTYLLIRNNEMTPVDKEEAKGFHYFNILKQMIPECIMDVTLLMLEPGATRSFVTSDALEYIYLLDGEIEYTLGRECFKMKHGDSIFFNGRIPHLKKNFSGAVARILVIYLLENKNND